MEHNQDSTISLPPVPSPLPEVSSTPLPAPSQAAAGVVQSGATPTLNSDALLRDVLLENIKEKRRARRWNTFFKLSWLVIILWLLWLFNSPASDMTQATENHTALVSIEGEISANSEASAEHINASLKAAFEAEHSQAVVLRINSPGGSPVQAGMVYDEIKRLRAQHKKPLYVVVEEMCASGGYYIAAAADRIYVDKASIVGSIGVLMDGFGFTDLMKKVGVERRLLTAGENKGFLDPFSPQTEKQKVYAEKMLGEIHQQFISAVRNGRGKKLKETPEIFSGLFWSGAQSIELGLADEVGTLDSVARDVVHAEEVVDYTKRESLPARFAKRMGASFGEGVWRSATQFLQLK